MDLYYAIGMHHGAIGGAIFRQGAIQLAVGLTLGLAMAAGVSAKLWSLTDMVRVIDE